MIFNFSGCCDACGEQGPEFISRASCRREVDAGDEREGVSAGRLSRQSPHARPAEETDRQRLSNASLHRR